MTETSGVKVLIVEDEPNDVEILQRSLQRLGLVNLETAVASSGAGARETLGGQIFDLALVDLHLPDTTGYELVQFAKSQSPEMPVVIVTSLNSEDAALEAGRAGADDYIIKDDLLGSALGRTLRKILRSRIVSHDSRLTSPVLDAPSEEIDTRLAWKFPEDRVPPGTPDAGVLEAARSGYGQLLHFIEKGNETELRSSMGEFEEFAYRKKIPADCLIAIHRELFQPSRKGSESSRQRYLLFELLAALLERHRAESSA